MGLLQVIVLLVVLGLVLSLIESGWFPIPPPIKMVIRALVVLVVILWLLALVGLIPGFGGPVVLKGS